MGTYILTGLQYSDDRRGPWKLYIYTEDGKKYEYIVWFAKEPNYEDDETSIADAFATAMEAIHGDKREVRVCDSGDMLVFHSQNGETLHGEHFWRDILLKKEKTK